MSEATVIVNLLSGPRNVSTALMYSFAQRADCSVVDEPLYGHYLRLTRAPQPHRDELLNQLETDGAKVVRETILSPPDRPVFFVKNMAHHLVDLDTDWLADPRVHTVFLIRDPRQMLPSLVNQIAEPTMRDAAYEAQARWFRELEKTTGRTPVVIDAKPLLLDPASVLGELCERLGIDFDPAMLSWPAGPRPEDGPWAPYWYHNLHRSTGFSPYREKTDPVPATLEPLIQQCLPHYQTLLSHAIGA